MNATLPRYEFRAFAQDFGRVEEAMRGASPVTRFRESREVYVLSRASDRNNTKVRGGLMDIKVQVGQAGAFEQWEPRLKADFPLPDELLREQVFPAFEVETPVLTRATYSLREFVELLVDPHPSLTAVHVYKLRYGFDIDGCMAELADVYVNGAYLRTASVESADPDAMERVCKKVFLSAYENVNYLLALKRVVGMAPLAEGVFFRGW